MWVAVRRRSRAALVLAVTCGALAGWMSPSRHRWRQQTLETPEVSEPTPSIDPVTEASEESFPASDAPAWTASAASARTDAASR
jgi:hypothetical protein